MGGDEPMVVVVAPGNVKNKKRPFEQSNFLRFYKEDILKSDKGEKIATIKLKDNINVYQYEPLLLELEKAAKEAGGNYVVVTELAQLSQPKFINKIQADVYKVNDVKRHEIFFRWSKNRDISLSDYEKDSSIEDKPRSSLKYDTRLVMPKKYKWRLDFLNEFHFTGDACEKCTPVDIKRENVKFDLIELYLRRQTKYGVERNWSANDFLKNKIFFAYYDSIEQKLNQLNHIDDLDSLGLLDKQINKEIEKLEAYKDKSVIMPIRNE